MRAAARSIDRGDGIENGDRLGEKAFELGTVVRVKLLRQTPRLAHLGDKDDHVAARDVAGGNVAQETPARVIVDGHDLPDAKLARIELRVILIDAVDAKDTAG